jgi:hypothetical protein
MSFILNYYTPFKDAVKEMKGHHDANAANEEVRHKLYEGKLNSYAFPENAVEYTKESERISSDLWLHPKAEEAFKSVQFRG